MSRPTLLLCLPLLFAACKDQASVSPTPNPEVIEVLQHDEGSFTRRDRIPVGAVGATFTVDEIAFTVTHRWPHAETNREVTDDAEQEHHAVEVAWREEGEEQSQWIFQTESDETISTLDPIGTMIRVTAPGARPPLPDDTSFPGQVQFLWRGRHYDLPAIGGEVFDGWKLTSTRDYHHALMGEDGSVAEADDADFTNRVLEVHLANGNGTEERHIAFLDHPEITRGIHPTILPVTRISGDGASLSRLVVCTAIEPAPGHHRVSVSPGMTDQELTVRVCPKGDSECKTITVRQLPAEIPLADDVTLRLKRHFTKARPHVKWERRDSPGEGEAKPALLIEHRVSHHQKTRFVLVRDEVTPCRIGDRHLMLRYAAAAD